MHDVYNTLECKTCGFGVKYTKAFFKINTSTVHTTEHHIGLYEEISCHFSLPFKCLSINVISSNSSDKVY